MPASSTHHDRFARPDGWKNRIVRSREAARSGNHLEALRLIVDALRPTSGVDPSPRVEALATHLSEGDGSAGADLGEILRHSVSELHIFAALTESGVGGHRSLPGELISRIGNRLAPPAPDPTDLRDTVLRLFRAKEDHLWVAAVSDDSWCQLLTALGITSDTARGVGPELGLALRVSAHHAASLGLQPAITQRLHLIEEGERPFLRLGDRVIRYLEHCGDEVEGNEAPLLTDVLETVELCRKKIERLREDKGIYGTSLELTGLSFRLLRRLDRVELLLRLTEPHGREFQTAAIRFLKELLRAEQTRTRLLLPIKESADLLAYQIVEHAARKGSTYITTGRRDYGQFLLASMGGGLLVAIFALIKVGMGGWEMPLGIQAIVYGINYAICFVLILLTGSALATKQPAMTANTLARSLGEEGENMQGLEDLVVRVWRSQFISFVGNVVVALPVAFLISNLFVRLSGGDLGGPDKAMSLLNGLDPLGSAALFYAGVAGVYLFLAGLVSGWIDNWALHNDISGRLERHGVLARVLGSAGTRWLADLVHRKLGALAGNVFLGFALGSTGTIGLLLGLPLDIRHIAFSSAQFGYSLEVLRFGIPTHLLVSAAIGVLLIGLVNFLVSFGLSLLVALESRGVGFRQMRTLPVRLGRRFVRSPVEWFFPAKAN